MFRCLGLKPDIEKVQINNKLMNSPKTDDCLCQAKLLAGQVSVDVTGFSVSFNEYLRLISLKRRAEPDEDALMEVFRCNSDDFN